MLSCTGAAHTTGIVPAVPLRYRRLLRPHASGLASTCGQGEPRLSRMSRSTSKYMTRMLSTSACGVCAPALTPSPSNAPSHVISMASRALESHAPARRLPPPPLAQNLTLPPCALDLPPRLLRLAGASLCAASASPPPSHPNAILSPRSQPPSPSELLR